MTRPSALPVGGGGEGAAGPSPVPLSVPPALASSSVRNHHPSSTCSVAPTAVSLHVPFIVQVSQEGKSRAPEVRLLGLARDAASLSLSVLP